MSTGHVPTRWFVLHQWTLEEMLERAAAGADLDELLLELEVRASAPGSCWARTVDIPAPDQASCS